MRLPLKLLAFSASALVALAGYEGYREYAYTPVKGDVATIGFGTTENVKLGDKTDPVTALNRKIRDIQKFEGALKECVKVPLAQHEYDAYLSLAYNIGPQAFCSSTLVRKLNTGDYAGACKEILKWDKFKGKALPGLTKRRQSEYQQCIG
jgi:lysozyme